MQQPLQEKKPLSYPCIVISRHGPGFYEWAVVMDQEQFDGDVSDSSIVSCLQRALAGIPNGLRLVEVRHRGGHMGTFEKDGLAAKVGELAAKFAESHAALTHDN